MPRLSQYYVSRWLKLAFAAILLVWGLSYVLSFLRLNLLSVDLMQRQLNDQLNVDTSSGIQDLKSKTPECRLFENGTNSNQSVDEKEVRYCRLALMIQFLAGLPFESVKHNAQTLQAANPEDDTVAWLLARSAFEGGRLNEVRDILHSASIDESMLAYAYAEEAFTMLDSARATDILDALDSWKFEPVVAERSPLYDLACAAYRDTNRGDDSVMSCLKLVDAMPKSSGSWAQLANAYLHAGQFSAAIAAAQQAVTLDPTSAEPRITLGVCYQSAGMFAAADESYETAIRLEPDSAQARLALAASLLDQNRCTEAKAVLDMVGPRTPDLDSQLLSLETKLMERCHLSLDQPAATDPPISNEHSD